MNQNKYDLTKHLHSLIVDDIRYVKELQLKITNYSIVLFAAIVSTMYSIKKSDVINHTNQIYYCFALVLIVACATICFFLLVKTHNSLKLSKLRLENIKRAFQKDKVFSKYFKKLFQPEQFEEKIKVSFQIEVIYFSVIIVGAIISCVLIYTI